MRGHKPSEIELFLLLNADRRLAACGLSCSVRKSYGVVVSLKGKPLGVWGYPADVLCFRRLDTWETLIEVSTPEEAIEASVAMARGP